MIKSHRVEFRGRDINCPEADSDDADAPRAAVVQPVQSILPLGKDQKVLIRFANPSWTSWTADGGKDDSLNFSGPEGPEPRSQYLERASTRATLLIYPDIAKTLTRHRYNYDCRYIETKPDLSAERPDH